MKNVPIINAIPTEYNGITFRSRTEARWAVFFDDLGIKWQFEPEGYQLPGLGYYLPDFWLKGVGESGTFFEVKPRPMDGTEKAEALSLLTMKPVAVTGGNEFDQGDIWIALPYRDDETRENYVSWDYYGFIRCAQCGRATLSYYGSCPRQEAQRCNDTKAAGGPWPRVKTNPQHAHQRAMKYSFWNPGGAR